ncbi:MAG: outer membrane protein assembly factor BamD [Paludibacteraceae bacterium]|nr:outer membrane protein assembly factor BamD [Paludibacteraceae bacterium]
MKKVLLTWLFCLFCGTPLLYGSAYTKLLKNGSNEEKYQAAQQFFAKGDYAKTITLLEQVSRFYRGTKDAENVTYLLATSYTKRKDYISGAHYYQGYTTHYLQYPHYQECMYMLGYCYFQLSPEAELDQSNTMQAIEQFEAYLDRFPHDKHSDEVRSLLSQLREKLAERELANAKLYYNLGDYRGNNYRAAIITAQNAMNDYPDTRYLEDFAWIVVRSKYQEAMRSVEEKKDARCEDAYDECYYFLKEYPETKHAKEIEKYTKQLKRHF